MYSLTFYVPQSHLDVVKSAVFAAGAGNYDHYDQCCWQTQGQGQFRPKPGSTPFIGDKNTLTIVDEYRVEMIVPNESIQATIEALKTTHPYETPAYTITSLADI